ncbi:MAG: hypothetical protein ACR2KG_06255 [Nocardioidaceae bacterium]
MSEEATPIAYTALAADTPVQASDGHRFGVVERVLSVPELDVFDGIVVRTDGGSRFVDASQVGQITTSYVECRLSADQAANLPEPEGEPTFTVDPSDDSGNSLADRFGRMFGRGKWKRNT